MHQTMPGRVWAQALSRHLAVGLMDVSRRNVQLARSHASWAPGKRLSARCAAYDLAFAAQASA